MVWVAISWILFYAIHSILLLPKVQKGIQNVFKWEPQTFRLFYNSVSLILLIIALAAYKVFPGQKQEGTPYYLRYLGMAMMVFSIWLAKRAFKSYNLPVFIGLKEEIQMPLSIRGMNRLVRHPLYSSSLLLFWSGVFVFPNSSYLLICIITTVYVQIGYRLEEKRMLVHFGKAYEDYMKKVPPLIPRLFSRH